MDFFTYRWGCHHEKQAREAYRKKMESVHENFQIFDSGLWINKDFPYLGASPDGIVSCDCCGIGLCEIKVTIYDANILWNLKHYIAGPGFL